MRNRNLVKQSPLDLLVTGLCADFARRERLINEGAVSRRTLTEIRYINIKILEAAQEVVEERYARLFIKEIGENIGFANTKIEIYSETFYKTLKKEIKANIAKKLHLTD